ncbi:MAG: hypothetical protein P8X55_16445, partial [Desulfosarcinaceae bacterium]
RGGCVLLKGVDFIDKFSDVSCNALREKLYKINHHYQYVVISQGWDLYNKSVLNFGPVDKENPMHKWEPFINATIEHFKPMSNKIILIGRHLKVTGTSRLNPTIFLSEQTYRKELNDLSVSNLDDILKSYSFFNQWDHEAIVMHPIDIWNQNNEGIKLHDQKWSFFSDSQHASQESSEYITKGIRRILLRTQLATKPRAQ